MIWFPAGFSRDFVFLFCYTTILNWRWFKNRWACVVYTNLIVILKAPGSCNLSQVETVKELIVAVLTAAFVNQTISYMLHSLVENKYAGNAISKIVTNKIIVIRPNLLTRLWSIWTAWISCMLAHFLKKKKNLCCTCPCF